MVEAQEAQVKPQPEGKLYLFFGLLNMHFFAQNMPFDEPLASANQEARMDHLRTRAVALTCPGFVRVFASHHASIQENAEGSIQTFGIYLTP